ncbi:MAG: peptidoglycan-binding protein [Propionibacteriaceae bacterium]|nr:peptidoglycan-binding protein [Propionibacteriaceae bacterium]
MIGTQLRLSGGGTWAVDGQALVNLPTSVPLWRDLTNGVTGADVSALQVELSRLGYVVEETGVYDQQTRKSLGQMLAEMGVELPPYGTLPLAWSVWLPQAELPLASWSVEIGDPVTAGSWCA